MYRSTILIATLALMLVACGGANTPTATSTTISPTTAATSAATNTTISPTTAATAAANTTSTAPATATTAAVRDSIYAALPQSVDADGYYVLGNANAPAVMTHYSDLL